MLDLTTVAVPRLLSLHSELLLELRARNIIRSSNNPTGDYAELLFQKAFDWSLNGKSSADVDAIDDNGNRYQIKCRKITRFNKSRQLGFIRRLPDLHFDFLAAVLLDENFEVIRGAIIPHSVVMKRSKYVESVSGWRMLLLDAVWDETGVHDVTLRLREAAGTI